MLGLVRFVKIRRGKRKGIVLDLERRKKSKLNLPVATGKPKYSTIPHPLMRLSRLALPEDSSPDLVEKAVEKFSASVTQNTQAGYATGVRHYLAAEKSLGRGFSTGSPVVVFRVTAGGPTLLFLLSFFFLH